MRSRRRRRSSGWRTRLQPWLAAGEYGVAEEAYAKLAAAVPEAQRREVQLAIVQLWVQQGDDRAAAARRRRTGRAAQARSLAGQGAEAAVRRCRRASRTPTRSSGRCGRRSTGSSSHYKADASISTSPRRRCRLKAVPPMPQAEAYAQFQLARLAGRGGAARDCRRSLKQYKATDKLALTDATKAAIAAYEKFITDHPTDPLAAPGGGGDLRDRQLVRELRGVRRGGGDLPRLRRVRRQDAVAVEGAAGTSSVAERAAFAAVSIVDVKARDAMAKTITKSTADNKGTPVPPAKISDEFAAAIAAYQDFIKAVAGQPAGQPGDACGSTRSRSTTPGPMRGTSPTRSTPDCSTDELATREPERIEFCRGMCQVGKVMPEHAKEVLAALLATRAAMATRDDGNGGAFGRGGAAGGGPGGGRADEVAAAGGAGGFGGGAGGRSWCAIRPLTPKMVDAMQATWPRFATRRRGRSRRSRIKQGPETGRRPIGRRPRHCRESADAGNAPSPRPTMTSQGRQRRAGGDLPAGSPPRHADRDAHGRQSAIGRRVAQAATNRSQAELGSRTTASQLGFDGDGSVPGPLRRRTRPPANRPRRGVQDLPGHPQQTHRLRHRRAGPRRDHGRRSSYWRGINAVAAGGGDGRAIPDRQPDRPAVAAASAGDRARTISPGPRSRSTRRPPARRCSPR